MGATPKQPMVQKMQDPFHSHKLEQGPEQSPTFQSSQSWASQLEQSEETKVNELNCSGNLKS